MPPKCNTCSCVVSLCAMVCVAAAAGAFEGNAPTVNYGLFVALKDLYKSQAFQETVCARHLGIMLRNKEATRMLDASSKIPSGILYGNVVDLGNYDECLNTTVTAEKEHFVGQYCKVSFSLKQFQKEHFIVDESTSAPQYKGMTNLISNDPRFSLGICVPSSCDMNELTKLIATKTTMKIDFCGIKKPISWSTGDIAVMAFFGAIIAAMAASTLYDLHRRNKALKPRQILVAFSVYTNGKKLFSTSSRDSGQLLCLNGIRFISMMWVVAGHVYYSSFYAPTTNNLEIEQWLKKVSSMYVIGATVSVDTFFLLSGMLLCYVFLGAAEKGVKFNIAMYYLHRYLRLTPALLAVVLVQMTVLRHMGDGPIWSEMTHSLVDNCRKYWWSTILYVQNYVNPGGFCIGQTWYLSVDMQLFILSPLLLLPLRRFPKCTMWVLGLLFLASCVSPFVVSWEDYIPGAISQAIGKPKFSKAYYYNTYVRFGPWIVGLMLGYAVYKRKEWTTLNQKLENCYVNLLGWILSIATLLAVVFGGNNLLFHPYDRFESSIFLALHRNAWAIAVSWVIYACVTGRGGLVNAFLSLPVFQVLAKLTYCIYLLHLTLQFMKVGRMRVARHFGDIDEIYDYWGDLMIPVMISIFWTLAFESPMICIEKILFTRGTKKPSSSAPKV